MFSTRATRCPACGGEIHPVAGRCKHCKQDLVELRAKQALEAAATAVPSAPAPASGTPPRGTLPAAPPPVIGPRTPPPPRPSPRLVPAPASPRLSWWRRWPLAAAGVALFLLGLAAGMMIERRRAPPSDEAISRAAAEPSDLTPEAIPTHPLPPMHMDPAPGAGPPSGPPPSAADVHNFIDRLGAGLCDKAIECGLFPADNRDDCEAVVRTQPDPDVAAKIARGECVYQPASATACLRAVEDIDCSADTADSLFSAMSGSLLECEQAFHCR